MTSSMDSPMFDQRVADWLEDDPDVAPSQVLDTIVAAMPSIPQRRTSPWQRLGLRPAPRFGMAATAFATLVLLLLIALVGFAIVGSPRPTPTPAATPPATLQIGGRFASAIYGYSIQLPQGYSARAATEQLGTGFDPIPDSPGVDQISQAELGAGAQTLVSAGQLRVGETLDEWIAASAISVCRTPYNIEDLVVDGEAAKLLTFNICGGELTHWVSFVHGTRAYAIVNYSAPGQESTSKERFLSMLASFRFVDG